MTRRKNGDRQGIQRRETGEEKAENGLKKGMEKQDYLLLREKGVIFFVCVKYFSYFCALGGAFLGLGV